MKKTFGNNKLNMASKKYKNEGGKFYEELGNTAEYQAFLLTRKAEVEQKIANLTTEDADRQQKLVDYEAELDHIDEELDNL